MDMASSSQPTCLSVEAESTAACPHFHRVMLITTAMAFLHKNPQVSLAMRKRRDKMPETISLDIHDGNSSVMLSKALVCDSLGFMRNKDGLKIASEGLSSTFGLGVLCIEARSA